MTTSTTQTSSTPISPTPPSTTDHQETFQVHFPPNKTFTLTTTMLHRDSPSMFSLAFLSSNFRENSSRTIIIPDKSPDLFPFILDYLRGYNIFPLLEPAVPANWLPLSKLYDNLRRDAAYYGLLRLERECSKWYRRVLRPEDRQAVLRLDFAPFTPGVRNSTTHPVTADMVLDVHLADVQLLRKRFLKAGLKPLTYGPFPWKQIFEQIREPSDRDNVFQSDGSSIIELSTVFLKPPRDSDPSFVPDDDLPDDRNFEFAKLHISKPITQLILDNIKPAGLNSNIALRFHATDTTSLIRFSAPPHFSTTDVPLATTQFLFSDKLQSDGYASLLLIARNDALTVNPEALQDCGVDPMVAMEEDADVALQVDGETLLWRDLCEWSRVHSESVEERAWRKGETQKPEYRRVQALFGGNHDSDTGVNTVPPPFS